jgi:hypothetical protein
MKRNDDDDDDNNNNNITLDISTVANNKTKLWLQQRVFTPMTNCARAQHVKL